MAEFSVFFSMLYQRMLCRTQRRPRPTLPLQLALFLMNGLHICPLRSGSICRTSCSRAPCRRSGDQANGKPVHQKSKEGQRQKVSCGRCANWQPDGVQIPAHEAEGFHDHEVQHTYAEVHHPYVYDMWLRSPATAHFALLYGRPARVPGASQ